MNDTESVLYNKTLDLLRNRSVKIKLVDISEATGIPIGWIKSLNSGNIREPSVVRIEKVYNFLSKKQLKL